MQNLPTKTNVDIRIGALSELDADALPEDSAVLVFNADGLTLYLTEGTTLRGFHDVAAAVVRAVQTGDKRLHAIVNDLRVEKEILALVQMVPGLKEALYEQADDASERN